MRDAFDIEDEKSRARRKQQELDDLNNEMADRETGRQRRFIDREDERTPKGREKAARAETLTRLLLLMSNPEYAKAYNETFDLLRRSESAVERALTKSEIALTRAKKDLQELNDRAQRLQDGTRVYRDTAGRVRAEDGRLIEGPEREGIEWKPDAPNYEDYLVRKEALEKAERDDEALRLYQVEVLGPARSRLEDQDNPPSMEELADIRKGIEEKMPPSAKAEMQDRSRPQPEASLDGAQHKIKPPPII